LHGQDRRQRSSCRTRRSLAVTGCWYWLRILPYGGCTGSTLPTRVENPAGPPEGAGAARHLLEAVVTECAIADHGLIGDLHTAAWVDPVGSVNWFCCRGLIHPACSARLGAGPGRRAGRRRAVRAGC